jgi:hypothetical protein
MAHDSANRVAVYYCRPRGQGNRWRADRRKPAVAVERRRHTPAGSPNAIDGPSRDCDDGYSSLSSKTVAFVAGCCHDRFAGKETIMARTDCRCNPATRLAVLVLVLGGLLGPLVAPAQARILFAPKRFTFKIDAKTPVKELLPAPPTPTDAPAPWLVRDLTEVPEVMLQAAEPVWIGPRASSPIQEKQRMAEVRDKAMERTAYLIARVNHLNQYGTDHFLKTLRQHRPDLDGLPFIMGTACRQSPAMGKAFLAAVDAVRDARFPRTKGDPGPQPSEEAAEQFWGRYRTMLNGSAKAPADQAVRNTAAQIAALVQVLAPEDVAMRRGLVEHHLAAIANADATRALAQLAIFSFEAQVRKAALAALKDRRNEYVERLVADVLLAGMRHPWPAVACNAGDAVAQLGRKDLAPQLVTLLDEPDPRAPVETEVNGKKTLAVRELVRINHLRNCVLCHAPGNTSDVIEKGGMTLGAVVTGPVPSPEHELVPPSQGYGHFMSPDILVRADVTYLRQEFSLLQPVKNAAPWPEMQRFDFLVRTRTVTDKDAAAYQTWLERQGPAYLAPHRQAALTALRALTGRDAAPTALAWRAVLED